MFGGIWYVLIRDPCRRGMCFACRPLRSDTCIFILTISSNVAEGEKVITGTLCSHMFHSNCSLAWMKKGSYNCPCCRKAMFDPVQLQQAAKDLLGEDRMDELARYNKAVMTGTLPE